MKKALVIIRTSTKAQEIEAQRKEVIEWAMKDGYTMEEIAVVGQQGASAIKLDEAYLANLQRVYDTINTEPIECVYAWAIDRIARKEKILMELKDLLIEKQINLKIKNPSLALLNADGTVNSGVELAFSLFATMAKQEMEQKQARFARAKKQNKEDGKYNGGAVQWGYTVESKYIVPSEEADKVREIFNLYASGNYSTAKLAKELNARGERHNGKLFTDRFVATTLKNLVYKGGTTKANTYPSIVSEEVWNKCAEVRSNLTITPNRTKESKHIHLGLGILKCSDCGRNYTTCDGGRSYVCTLHAKKYLHGETCNNNVMISTKVFDKILWAITCRYIEVEMFFANSDEIKRNKQKIQLNLTKIDNITEDIMKAKQRNEALEERFYVNGDLEKARFDVLYNKNLNIISKLQSDIDILVDENKNLTKLTEQNQVKDIEEIKRSIKNNSFTDAQKKEYIARFIKEATVKRIELNGRKAKEITVYDFIGIKRTAIVYRGKDEVTFEAATKDEFFVRG